MKYSNRDICSEYKKKGRKGKVRSVKRNLFPLATRSDPLPRVRPLSPQSFQMPPLFPVLAPIKWPLFAKRNGIHVPLKFNPETDPIPEGSTCQNCSTECSYKEWVYCNFDFHPSNPLQFARGQHLCYKCYLRLRYANQCHTLLARDHGSVKDLDVHLHLKMRQFGLMVEQMTENPFQQATFDLIEQVDWRATMVRNCLVLQVYYDEGKVWSCAIESDAYEKAPFPYPKFTVYPKGPNV